MPSSSTSSTRAKVEGVARVTLDNVVGVQAVGEATDMGRVEAVGEATDKARVEAEGLVSIPGNTHIERELIRLLRCVYTHLYINRAGEYLDFCTVRFANTLVMTPTDIQLAIRRDLVLCRAMVARSKGMALSARLSEAGDACNEMGILLVANMRGAEGGFWCREAMGLWYDSADAKRRENQLVKAQRPIHVVVEAEGVRMRRGVKMRKITRKSSRMRARRARRRVWRCWRCCS
jgi:hypothetical protein